MTDWETDHLPAAERGRGHEEKEMSAADHPAGGPNRRQFLKSAGLGIATVSLSAATLDAVLAACGGSAQSPSTKSTPVATKNLVYAGYGGVYEQGIRKAWVEPFAQQTGINVSVTTGSSDVAKITAMVKAGHPDWDVADAQGTVFGQLVASGLLEKLDTSIVKTNDLADPNYINPYGVACYVFSHNIFWNTKAFSGPLTSWADVWDVKRFPGKRGFQKTPWFTLEVALVADGVPMHKLYPLDVDRAFKSLEKIKPYLVFQDLNTLTNLFAQQEIVTGDLNLARVKQLVNSGVPLKYTWNQAMLDIERLVVLKGATNVVNAMKMVEYTLQPDAQLQVLKLLGYSPTVKSAISKIDPEQAKDLPGTPATLPNSFVLDGIWWGQNGTKVGQRFQEWLLTIG
jgi:putative spermidine/putrescine transport system substrate-binding protein